MLKRWSVIYGAGILLMLTLTIATQRTAQVFSDGFRETRTDIIVLDAGHGWPDGGATSCTGVQESDINLEITKRLEDLLHLLGYKTVMIRKTGESVYTSGDTIAQKKMSDLKERVRIADTSSGTLLISIHQNTFSDERYYGPQVFYGKPKGSKEFAKILQSVFTDKLPCETKRAAKPATGIYLMEQTEIPGVLVECGFLSNRREEALLRDGKYQKKICCVIASAVGTFLLDS